MDEGRRIQQVFHGVLEKMPMNPSTSKLLEVLGNSQAVQSLFIGNTCQFYPIVVGSPPGIHRTRYEI